MLQEMKEANLRAEESISMNVPQEDEQLSATIEEIRRQYEQKIQQVHEETVADYEQKARLDHFVCSFCQV